MAEYIEKAVLIKRLEESRKFFEEAWGDFHNMPTEYKARVDEIVNCIADVVNAPSADVEPIKRSRWKSKEYWSKGNFYKVRQCSICGYCVSPRLANNYCPHCGCKMYLG